MLPSEQGPRAAIGVSGSGKTHWLRSEVYQAVLHMPVVVLDSMGEWDQIPQDIAPMTAGAMGVAQAMQHLKNGARLVITRIPDTTADPAAHVRDLTSAASALARWALTHRGLAGLAIPEVHLIAPVTGPVPIELTRIATAWRHHHVALWVDTQRFSTIHHSISSNARSLRIFAQWDAPDIARVRECVPVARNELVAAVQECARRLAPKYQGGNDEPGWHVHLGMYRMPPFKLERI